MISFLPNVLLLFISLYLLGSLNANGKTIPDWSKHVSIRPGENRGNIYGLDEEELQKMQTAGQIHAMKYPVSVTGILIPYGPFKNLLRASSLTDAPEEIIKLQADLFFRGEELSSIGSNVEVMMYKWLGLSPHNGPHATGIYKMPYPNGVADQFYVGAGLVSTPDGDGLTYSCFACHATNLFGTTVMGLTNKRPHANKAFHFARKLFPKISPEIYQMALKATDGEVKMFEATKSNLRAVGGVLPQVWGLDTSLPHVALSLAKRQSDEHATKDPYLEKNPRDNELNHFVADSKPMPWWNLKYKTRWLSDGSVVSGNPIFTNFLWNEIGRGTDLRELEEWMKNSTQTIEEITTAVFATEAPRYTDFFPVRSISIDRAKKGEAIFKASCAKCHGDYEKAWSDPKADQYSSLKLLETTRVVYHDKTPVKDVGTDPQRYQAMKYFADSLNNLAISKWMKTEIVPQMGYVPPPLVGIWARYPYFHNGSIPNLCALLTPPELRPKRFIMGPALDKNTDFDQNCIGYPVGNKIPKHWLLDVEAYMDTSKPGLGNTGHYKMLLDESGKEKYSREEKRDLIEFLKTL